MTPLAGEMPGPIPDVDCRCYDPEDALACVCSPTERALRAGGPLTPEQRKYCLDQIAQVEGWDRRHHENDDDAQIGRSVIAAWVDYCRDKGML